MSLGGAATRLNLPVFPCGRDKRPVIEHGFKAATTDPETIRKLFERPGAELIGVPTGSESGIVVIDVDVRDDRSGMEWLNANSANLPPTRTHKTRSGGLHLLFRYPVGHDIRNSASRIAPGIDVRGVGGYFIAPPSPGYQVADPTEAAEMPGWLVRACCKPEKPALVPAAPADFSPAVEGGTRYGLAALDNECRSIVGAMEGTKHAALNKGAYSIGGLVANGELDEGTARDSLRSALERIRDRCADYPAAERTLEQAFDAGKGAPRSKPEQRARPTASFEPPAHMLEVDAGYYESLEVEAGTEWEPAGPESEPAAKPETPKGQPTPVLWSITDPWEEEEIAPRPWIAKGYIMRGSVAVVSGPGSAGKSSLMVAWATCMALGSAFHRFRVLGPLRVGTYNVEDDADEQKRRFSAMAQQFGIPVSTIMQNLTILGPTGIGTLIQMDPNKRVMVNTETMKRLVEWIERTKPDVLILDPFVELHGEEENDNTAIRAVMATFRTLAKEHDLGIVLLHHTRKGAASPGDPDSMRGASSIVGAARVALTLNVMTDEEAEASNIQAKRRRDFFRLDGAKSNYAPIEEAEWFERKVRDLKNGDQVAIAWPWNAPNIWADRTPADFDVALCTIAQGYEPGVLYAATKQGNSSKRWVGFVIMNVLGFSETQAKEVVEKWLRDGTLERSEFMHPKRREMVSGVTVNRDRDAS